MFHLVARLHPSAAEPEVCLRDAVSPLQPIHLALLEGGQYVRAGQCSHAVPGWLPSARSQLDEGGNGCSHAETV